MIKAADKSNRLQPVSSTAHSLAPGLPGWAEALEANDSPAC